jgi:hypothetical protein
MPPKKSVEVKKKSAPKSSKIVWSEVVEGFNVKEKQMKAMKVTKVCRYDSATTGNSRFRLAGEDAKTGQAMSKFASAQDALDIAELAGLKVQKCVLKPRVVKVKKVAKAEKAEKPKAKAAKPKAEKAEKPKAKAAKPKAEKAVAKPKAKKATKAKPAKK